MPVPELPVKIVAPVAPGRREIQIKSKNSRSSQLVTIEIERIPEGYQGKGKFKRITLENRDFFLSLFEVG